VSESSIEPGQTRVHCGSIGSPESPTRRRFLRRTRQRYEDEGAYQVDLVVAFFVTLLILFMMYSVQLVSQPSEPSQITYRAEDPPSTPFSLKSFSPLYPFRDVWVVKNGAANLIDFQKIAYVYLREDELEVDTFAGKVGIAVEPHSIQIDAYSISIYLSDGTVPNWMAKNRLLVDETEKLYKIFKENKRGAFVFLWENAKDSIQPLTTKLRNEGIPHEIKMMSDGKNTIRMRINGSRFNGRSILRPL
jgi:hypothetical protein